MEEGDVVAEKFVGVYHPLYDIPLHYGGLNVEEGDVATEVMDDFFGYVKDDNQDAMLSIEVCRNIFSTRVYQNIFSTGVCWKWMRKFY